jgi:hypothetical protein
MGRNLTPRAAAALPTSRRKPVRAVLQDEPMATPELDGNVALLRAMLAYNAGEGVRKWKWNQPFLIGHSAYHTMDHARELQDKDLTGTRSVGRRLDRPNGGAAPPAPASARHPDVCMRRPGSARGAGAPQAGDLAQQVGAVLGSEGEGDGRVHASTIALRWPVRHRDDAQSCPVDGSHAALAVRGRVEPRLSRWFVPHSRSQRPI